MLCRKLLAHNEINSYFINVRREGFFSKIRHNQINSYFINVRREGFFSKIRMAELDGCGLAC